MPKAHLKHAGARNHEAFRATAAHLHHGGAQQGLADGEALAELLQHRPVRHFIAGRAHDGLVHLRGQANATCQLYFTAYRPEAAAPAPRRLEPAPGPLATEALLDF